MVAVKAIPGLRYALVRGETLPAPRGEGAVGTVWGGSTVVESVVATGARVALTDANPPKGGAFYVISVSCPAAVGPSDSTIRIVGGRVYSGQYDINDTLPRASNTEKPRQEAGAMLRSFAIPIDFTALRMALRWSRGTSISVVE